MSANLVRRPTGSREHNSLLVCIKLHSYLIAFICCCSLAHRVVTDVVVDRTDIDARGSRSTGDHRMRAGMWKYMNCALITRTLCV